MIILFAGPDGSGKSTLSENLSKQIQNSIRKYFGYTRKDVFIQYPRCLKRLYTLFSDMVWILKNRNRKIIADRYIYDNLVNTIIDKNPSFFIYLFLSIIYPRPKYVFLLSGDVGKIFYRKKEISKDRIKRFSDIYSKILHILRINTIIINTTESSIKNTMKTIQGIIDNTSGGDIKKVIYILKDSNIEYFIMRPFSKNDDEIDLFISRENIFKLISYCQNNFIPVKYSIPHKCYKIRLFIFGIMLDISYRLSFLSSGKLISSIVLKQENIRLENGYYYPVCPEDMLFTIWSFHNILDKKDPRESSTFDIYKKRYQDSYKRLISSDFFNVFSNKILKSDAHNITKSLFEAFEKNWDIASINSIINNRKNMMMNQKKLFIKHLNFKIRHALLRMIIKDEPRNIKKIAFKRGRLHIIS